MDSETKTYYAQCTDCEWRQLAVILPARKLSNYGKLSNPQESMQEKW